ncbi:MAG: capsule assembly Wzi family protein [Gemmatimonadaceae bacterium]
MKRIPALAGMTTLLRACVLRAVPRSVPRSVATATLIPAFALVTLAASTPGHAQHPLAALPLSDPAYVQLDAIARAGCRVARVSPYRPFLVGAIRNAVAAAAQEPRCASTILDVLRDRFPGGSPADSAGLGEVGSENGVGAGAALTLRAAALSEGTFHPLWRDIRATGEGDAPLVGVLSGRLSWSGGDRLYAVTEAYAQSDRRNDPRIRASSFRGSDAVLDFSEAYVSGRLSALVLTLGRGQESWLGDGEESLVLSANSPPLDRIGASVRWSRLELRALFASLDDVLLTVENDNLVSGTPPQNVNRWLSAHAVTFRASDALELTLGETAIIGDRGSGIDLSYVNPLMLFLVTENDTARSGREDLNNIAVFGAVRASAQGVTVTGELVVDDIQIDSRDRAVVPDQLAWRVVGDFALPLMLPASFSAGYERVGSFAYLKRPYSAVYQHYDAPLGSELGPDADRVRLAASIWPSGRVRITGGISRWRRGAQRIYGRPAPTPIGRAGEPFPTVSEDRPAVQRSWIAEAGIDWLDQRLPVRLEAELARVTNRGNQVAVPELLVRVRLVGSYRFRYP